MCFVLNDSYLAKYDKLSFSYDIYTYVKGTGHFFETLSVGSCASVDGSTLAKKKSTLAQAYKCIFQPENGC